MSGLKLMDNPRACTRSSRSPGDWTANLRSTSLGGREHAAAVGHPKGTVAKPFTPAEVETKFRELTAVVLPPTQIGTIVKRVRSLEEIDDVALLERDLATQSYQ